MPGKLTPYIKPGLFALSVILGIFFLFELNFFFLDTIKKTGQEVSARDVYFSHLQNRSIKGDQRIILIDVGDTLPREKITTLLYHIRNSNPAVIGVDIIFKDTNSSNQADNQRLLNFAKSSTTAVFAVDEQGLSSFFKSDSLQSGFGWINFGNEGNLTPIRSVLNNASSDTLIKSFAYEVAKKFQSDLPSLAEHKKDKEILINYRPIRFLTIPAENILHDSTGHLTTNLSGKIVLLGGLNVNSKDLYPVPNAGYIEKEDSHEIYTNLPGLYINALAIATLLDNEGIRKNNFLNAVLLIILYLVSLILFVNWDRKYLRYMRLIARGYILVASIVLLVLYVYLLNRWNIEINLLKSLLVLILTVELVEVYEPLVRLYKIFILERIKSKNKK